MRLAESAALFPRLRECPELARLTFAIYAEIFRLNFHITPRIIMRALFQGTGRGWGGVAQSNFRPVTATPGITTLRELKPFTVAFLFD